MRLVLALIAALVNAAGPWLCCCVLTAAISGPRPAAAKPAPAAEQAAVRCPSCCHVPDPAPADGQQRPADSPKKPAHHCPCKERVVAATVLPRVVAEAGQGTAFTFDQPCSLDTPAAVVGAVDAAAAEPINDLPFMPTATRLWAHHVLRC